MNGHERELTEEADRKIEDRKIANCGTVPGFIFLSAVFLSTSVTRLGR